MANNIITVDVTKQINNKYAVCSALPTGAYSKRLIRANYPKNLTIENIEDKYDNRFDDPSYYYGIGNSNVIGT